jgi:hypothetical protein
MFVAIIAFVRHMELVLEPNSVGILIECCCRQHEHLCGSFQWRNRVRTMMGAFIRFFSMRRSIDFISKRANLPNVWLTEPMVLRPFRYGENPYKCSIINLLTFFRTAQMFV